MASKRCRDEVVFFCLCFLGREMPTGIQLTYIFRREWRNGMDCWMLILRTHIIKTLELLVNAILSCEVIS